MFDLIFFLMLGAISLLFVFIPFLLSFFSSSMSKATPLESGFVPLDEANSNFNNQFFTLLVIFIIFDLEVVLSICVVCLWFNSWFLWILILFIGLTLVFEWWFNKVGWSD